jgi:MFS transporter, Spinster family, sphingosine-1-phosphate transporter
MSYRNYLLIVLLVVLSCNYVDRLALGLLLQDIKSDLDLSDTQLGFLSGVAFALFYSLMGLPIARWADRGNRVLIISITTALWSGAVALCGAANSFLQLLLIRIGVAVGEAGCMPPAHSLIADYFTRAERPRAVARYMLGGPLSVIVGYFAAGWLNEFYGWRVTFVVLGVPGLALALLAWFTLKEPRFTRATVASSVSGATGTPSSARLTQTAPTLTQVCAVLGVNRTFRQLLYCFAVISFFSYGVSQWQPAFIMRSFGLSTGEMGTWFTLIGGLGGLLGTYWGGQLASRRAAHDERLQLKAIAILYCGFGLLSAFIYLAQNHYIAFALIGVVCVGGAMVNGPLFATLQTLVPERMRAFSIALMYLFANLVGMGLGPLAAGALSDALHPRLGEESLRYALLALCPGYVWGAWHLWQASKSVAADLDVCAKASMSQPAR